MSVLRSSSLRGRITRTLVGLGLVSVVLLATVNFFVVRTYLDRGTRGQLETLRDLRVDAIELAIGRLLDRVAVLGTDPAVAQALTDFESAYTGIDDQLTQPELDRLAESYTPVTDRYDAAGVERPEVDELLPTSTAGQYVQYEYIAENEDEDRADLLDAGDGSAYTDAHVAHHEYLRELARSVGATDLLLVGLDTEEVVYSTDKRIDLGTSVTEGPYSETGLGESYAKLGNISVDDAAMADISFYLPNSSAPLAHVATAVRADSEVVGALILALPTERLTDIVNANQQWDLLGLGDTGEAYIVGSDFLMRTVPRPWLEDPEAYLDRYRDVTGDGVIRQIQARQARLGEEGVEPDEQDVNQLVEQFANLMEFTGTPVKLQSVDNEAVRTALDGERFIGGVDNYLGRSTLAAAAPLDVADLGWAVVTEQQTSETRHELEQFVVAILVLLAILLTALAVVGILLARILARPVRPLVEAAGRIADGDYETEVPDLGRNELGDVGRQLAAVADRLRAQDDEIAAEEQRINEMLESVLPAGLIERVRAGERELAEVVDDATVISISLRGIPEPSEAEQDAVVELTTRLAAETSRLAAEIGVERGQMALQQQIFVAGRGHTGTSADIAAEFAAAVVDRLPTIGTEYGIEIGARAGLSAGLVATGVIGSRQVAFSVWGAPVSSAIAVSNRADDGQIVVDVTLVDELGADWYVESRDGSDDEYVLRRAAAPVD